MLVFDCCIPSCGAIEPVQSLIRSFADQKIRPVQLIVLIWKERTVAELHEFATIIHRIVDPLGIDLVIQHAHYSDHRQGQGVGYDRHFLVMQANSPFMCLIDEDNVLPVGALDAWVAGYEMVVHALGHEAVVSPTIMRQGKIQSQGITSFSYLFPSYTYGRCGEKSRHEVKMLGANSLFGRTDLFQRIQFDPDFVGSYEDIDFTHRVVLAGYSLVVLRDVIIDHQESKKSFLGSLFLGNPEQAYYRSRNRILRVRKTATVRQKVQYFGCGLRVQTAGRLWYIFRSGVRKKHALLDAIFRGVWEGLTKKLAKPIVS